jgi:hypothetical protein
MSTKFLRGELMRKYWRLKFFRDEKGTSPDRVGYLRADSEADAADFAAKEMTTMEQRVELDLVITRQDYRLELGGIHYIT